jgi:hypothetical protein
VFLASEESSYIGVVVMASAGVERHARKDRPFA